MTITTDTIPSDQERQGLPSTTYAGEHFALSEILSRKVKSDDATFPSTQTGQHESSAPPWSTSPVQAQSFGAPRVTGLDKWEGKVVQIEGEIFTADLYPIDREDTAITADFDLELLGSDAATLVPGDTFYLWVRTVKAYGQRPTRTENLRLRRLGRITPEEVQKAYIKADSLMERLEQLFD
jgi:hypothetical protein